MLTATELAGRLNLSKGRISQLVSSGTLDGCYRGEGRQRRFDLDQVAEKLGHALHPGQMMGNGAATKRALKAVQPDAQPQPVPATSRDGPLNERDPDRYELARIDKAEQEARRLRRQNQQEEGLFVLASEVERQVARTVAQEVAEFEAVMKDSARKIADTMGVDFKSVRKLLMDAWRNHRGQRASVLQGQSGAAELTEAELAADI